MLKNRSTIYCNMLQYKTNFVFIKSKEGMLQQSIKNGTLIQRKNLQWDVYLQNW
jgi:hypothetical protein